MSYVAGKQACLIYMVCYANAIEATENMGCL